MMRLHTIRADDLKLVLFADSMRRSTGGRTCRLAAVSESPTLQTDCSSRPPSEAWLSDVHRVGLSRVRIGPIDRGRIGQLYQRVQRNGGRRETLRIWGLGIKALLAEPLYAIDGGNDTETS